MVLLIDNYDSFVFNLARYIQELGVLARVVRNDELTVQQVADSAPEAIILSPGPCTPRESGICPDVVRDLGPTIPILGVCLGHQAIGYALGANVMAAPVPVHGHATRIRHSGGGIFAGIPSPLHVGRYHSLLVDVVNLPKDLVTTAVSEDGIVMAIEHREWPLHGVQFHPESVLTERGHALLGNFLRMAGLSPGQPPRPEVAEPVKEWDFFSQPVEPGAGSIIDAPSP
jgi:anthranilate synthase/aminodeoxychorismate synthase-like glutamine amidotransferase